MNEKKRTWSKAPLINKIGFIIFTIVLVAGAFYSNS